MTCAEGRDGLTQADGGTTGNEQDVSPGGSGHLVTSWCRQGDGSWVAWLDYAPIGAGIDAYGQTAYGEDTDKRDWPSNVASTAVVGVGYFPDDGSPSTVYKMGIEAVFGWNTVGGIVPSDPCSHFPFLGDHYADNMKAQLISWGMGALDVQVRSDGESVWVVVLANEGVPYPYRWSNKTSLDDCGNHHANFESFTVTAADVFAWDTDVKPRADLEWIYGPGQLFNHRPFGPYDDAGAGHSLQWYPARVTVFGGDLGGFERIDTVEAVFDNVGSRFSFDAGACGGIECAASPTEPGVLHVMWSEAGRYYVSGDATHDVWNGQRITYSRWGPASKELEVELRRSDEPGPGPMSDANFVWTGEYILRNDHGTPCAIVFPWVCAGGPQYVGDPEYWDLTSGSRDVLQTLDAALVPTPAELGADGPPQGVGQLNGSVYGVGSMTRHNYASSLYTDPSLDPDVDVYIVCANYGFSGQAFFRVPCDGSDAFGYMDGVREVGYSILPTGSYSIAGDFVSEPDNVWAPQDLGTLSTFEIFTGGVMLHLDRQCFRIWEELQCFPPNPDGSGYVEGAWVASQESQPSVPAIVSDDIGDWVYGGGTGPQLTIASGDEVYAAALRAKICRCCLPCSREGLHVWQVL